MRMGGVIARHSQEESISARASAYSVFASRARIIASVCA
jgi:hypothetical protein